MGSAMAAAVGAPPSAGGMFSTLGSAIATWALSGLQVNPGAMAAASGVVSGVGSFTATGSAEDLGTALATAMGVPATATEAKATWVKVGGALINHFETYGVANGTGFSAGVPLTGASTLVWTSPVFVPTLSSQLEVTDPVAAVALEAFGTVLLAHILANAVLVSISLSGPPMSAPPTGPVVGTGTIT